MRLEQDKNYATRGVANAGLTTGIIGTALSGLNALAGGSILANGGMGVAPRGAYFNTDDEPVNRYEAKQNAKIAELETEIKLRDANTYTDQKSLELYQYVDGRLRTVEGQIAQQAVYNATNNATLGCIQGQIAQLQSLTKLVIPKTSVCPEPMDRYNSWTAPTAAEAT